MTTLLRYRAAALIAGLAAVVLAGVPTAVPASADTNLGSLTFSQSKGADTTPLWVITSGPCPAAATFVGLSMYGAGIPADGMVLATTTKAGLSRTDRMIAAFQDTLAGFAVSNGITFSGPYRVVLRCQDDFGQKVFGSYVGTLTFTDQHHFTAPYTQLQYPSGELPGGRPVIASPAASAPASPSPAPSTGSSSAASSPSSDGSVSPTSSAYGAATDTAGSQAAAVTASAAREARSNSPSWIFLGLGALLVLLGLGWVVRSRALGASVNTPVAPEREDEHVAG